MEKLNLYQQKFSKLRRNRQNGGAPHKPVLLLTVIDLYGRGLIRDKFVPFSDLLMATFHSVWQDLVGNAAHFNPTIIYPMYYLRTEGFWYPTALPGQRLSSKPMDNLRSFPHFKSVVAGAEIDIDLHLLLSDPVSRAVLQETLLRTYFPGQQAAFLHETDGMESPVLPGWTVQEPDIDLQQRPPKKREARLKWEEEKWIRQKFFPENVQKVYQHTCCVSGLRIAGPHTPTMIDACHIIPWKQTQDDFIQNGLALSPTLHRAFDSHLFTITEDYRVKVGQRFEETSDSAYRLRQFEGKRIALPANPNYQPDPQRLKWHNDQFIALEY